MKEANDFSENVIPSQEWGFVDPEQLARIEGLAFADNPLLSLSAQRAAKRKNFQAPLYDMDENYATQSGDEKFEKSPYDPPADPSSPTKHLFTEELRRRSVAAIRSKTSEPSLVGELSHLASLQPPSLQAIRYLHNMGVFVQMSPKDYDIAVGTAWKNGEETAHIDDRDITLGLRERQ